MSSQEFRSELLGIGKLRVIDTEFVGFEQIKLEVGMFISRRQDFPNGMKIRPAGLNPPGREQE